MAFISGIKDDDPVAGVFAWNMDGGRAISEWHQVFMRGDSPLTIAQRELIGAYTSGLNACPLCCGVHTLVAQSFGIDEGVITALVNDLDSAPVDDKLKALLRFVRKVNQEPSKMTQADADAVFAAGWDERALHDAVNICAMFNFMNRLVLGLGADQGKIGQFFPQLAKLLIDGGYDQPVYSEAGA